MTTRQKVEKLAAEMGVKIEIGGGRFYTVELLSPKGFQFGPELHFLASEGEALGKSSPAHAWAGALRDLEEYSLKPCPNDCTCKAYEE